MKSPVVIAALIGALTLGLYVTAGGQAGSPAAPTKVAVVNLQDVIDKSDAIAANRQVNQAKADAFRTNGEQRQQEIAALQTGLDPLQPGSDVWVKKRDELQLKTIELEAWVKLQEQNIQRDQARQFVELYTMANDAAQAVAQEAGYDIVLQGGDLPDLLRMPLQQVTSVISTRKVIYSGDSVDITEAVLQRLNADFAQR